MNAKADTDARRAAIAEGQAEAISWLGWLRIAARIAMVFTLLAVLLPVHYTWRAVHYGSPLPMLFLRISTRMIGGRVVCRGVPLRRDVFFVANHVSWIDIMALAGQSGTAFVAKGEVATVPVVGWLARLNRTVFVSREDRGGVAAQINALREALADNWSITVFPEGTTTDGKSLLPFKTPLLRVLEPPPPGVLVQPVMIDYGAIGEWIGWVGDETGLDNVARILARRGSFQIDVHFLEPFEPHHFEGRKAIAAECRRRIETALVAALGHPLRPFAYDVGPVGYNANPAPDLDSSGNRL